MRKLLVLIAIIASPCLAQVQKMSKGDYLVSKDGSSVVTKYTTQTASNKEARALSLACICKVKIVQPTIYVTTTVATPITLATLSFDRPTARVDGSSLPLSEIGGYELKRDTGKELIKSGGESMEYKTTPPKVGEKLYLATFDTEGVYSDFIEVGVK